jgi:hypothetical protein
LWMGEFNQAELKALAAGTVIPAHSGPARPGAANFVVADPSLAARSTPTVPESFHELLGERTGIQRPCVALGFAKPLRCCSRTGSAAGSGCATGSGELLLRRSSCPPAQPGLAAKPTPCGEPAPADEEGEDWSPVRQRQRSHARALVAWLGAAKGE